MSAAAGSGWAYPASTDQGGGIATSRFDQNIYESVLIILGTSPGERPLHPEFGCGIHDFVFAPNNSATHGLVQHHVREALVKWEPRIADVDVTARRDPGDGAKMLIAIRYRVATTGALQSLTYPFALQAR